MWIVSCLRASSGMALFGSVVLVGTLNSRGDELLGRMVFVGCV